MQADKCAVRRSKEDAGPLPTSTRRGQMRYLCLARDGRLLIVPPACVCASSLLPVMPRPDDLPYHRVRWSFCAGRSPPDAWGFLRKLPLLDTVGSTGIPLPFPHSCTERMRCSRTRGCDFTHLSTDKGNKMTIQKAGLCSGQWQRPGHCTKVADRTRQVQW